MQKEINVLKAFLNQAERWQRITGNPAAKLTVKGASKPRERLLSEEELGSLLEACPALLQALVEEALLTGMRRGELLALEERDCDFLREEIRVRHSKTGHARTIPMHPRVKEILWGLVRGVESREVFPIGNVQRPFAQAVKDAKLQDVRFHDLRHCAASYLFMRGADPRTVMEILGHRDPRMTLRVYARVSQTHLREAANRLSLPSRTKRLTILSEAYQGPNRRSER
ncbi:MAG: tyrosine-type recombinase/integrase [Candidatus Binatia bacterium]